MNRLRNALGLLVGVMLVGSSIAHAAFGWPPQHAGLLTAHAPPDLVTGLAVGWYFGGVAILTFGAIVLGIFGARLRGRPVSLAPAIVIAVAYLGYGLGAYAATRMSFMIGAFVVPGLLLLIAARPSRLRDA